MSERFKIEYIERKTEFGNAISYDCIITDQRTERTFHGIGRTKEDAKEDAWEDFDELDNPQTPDGHLRLQLYSGLPSGINQEEINADDDEDEDDLDDNDFDNDVDMDDDDDDDMDD